MKDDRRENWPRRPYKTSTLVRTIQIYRRGDPAPESIRHPAGRRARLMQSLPANRSAVRRRDSTKSSRPPRPQRLQSHQSREELCLKLPACAVLRMFRRAAVRVSRIRPRRTGECFQPRSIQSRPAPQCRLAQLESSTVYDCDSRMAEKRAFRSGRPIARGQSGRGFREGYLSCSAAASHTEYVDNGSRRNARNAGTEPQHAPARPPARVQDSLARISSSARPPQYSQVHREEPEARTRSEERRVGKECRSRW